MSEKTSYHVCMNLQTAIDMCFGIGIWGKSGKRKIVQILDAPISEILPELKKMEFEGYTAIPSEGCDNHDKGHCQGHKK